MYALFRILFGYIIFKPSVTLLALTLLALLTSQPIDNVQVLLFVRISLFCSLSLHEKIFFWSDSLFVEWDVLCGGWCLCTPSGACQKEEEWEDVTDSQSNKAVSFFTCEWNSAFVARVCWWQMIDCVFSWSRTQSQSSRRGLLPSIAPCLCRVKSTSATVRTWATAGTTISHWWSISRIECLSAVTCLMMWVTAMFAFMIIYTRSKNWNIVIGSLHMELPSNIDCCLRWS